MTSHIDARELLLQAERRFPATPPRCHGLMIEKGGDRLILTLGLSQFYPFALESSDHGRPVEDVLDEIEEVLRDSYPHELGTKEAPAP